MTTLPTIMDVCNAQRWPYPVSDDDLVAFVQRCTAAGIVTNCSDCHWWAEYVETTR